MGFAIGTLVGLLIRPVIDAYLHWKVARFYADALEVVDRDGASDASSAPGHRWLR